jgi:hypothetical protein
MTGAVPGGPGRITIDTDQIIQTSNVHFNIRQELIVTTEDKIQLCLRDKLQRIEQSKAWLTPFGIFLTLLLTFVTTTFRDFLFPKEVWQAVFVVLTLISFVWLVASWVNRTRAPKLEDVVEEIKKGAVARPTTQ